MGRYIRAGRRTQPGVSGTSVAGRAGYRRDYPDYTYPADGFKQMAARLAERALERLGIMLVPWLVVYLLLPAAGYGTHRLWGSAATVPWAASALTLTSVVATATAWAMARERLRRVHTAATVAVVMAWLLVATITGPLRRPTIDLLIWLGGTAAIIWDVRLLVPRNDGAVEFGDLGGVWRRVAERVGGAAEGSTLRPESVTGTRQEGLLQLEGGRTADQLQKLRSEIGSHLSVPVDGVKVMQVPEHADQARIVITTKDLLREPQPYPGPYAAGCSIGQAPIRAGYYGDGLPLLLHISGRARDVSLTAFHLGIMGMSRAGKSFAAMNLMMELWSRNDVVTWGADPVKAEQTLGPCAGGLDWIATTTGEARAMLRVVKLAIPARGSYLGRLDPPLMEWRPGCGLKYLVVWLEEAGSYLNDVDDVTEVIKGALSVGIMLVPSLQRATWDQIPTTARANIPAWWCFGVNDTADARYALDDLVDMGADPSLWKTERPGYSYCRAPGIPKDRQVIAVRSFVLSDDLAEVRSAAVAAAGRELDSFTAAVGGKSYAERRTGAAFRAETGAETGRRRQPQGAPAGVDVDADQAQDLRADADAIEAAGLEAAAEQTREELEAWRRQLQDGPEPDLSGDPDQQPPDRIVVEFGLPKGREYSQEEAQALLDNWLEQRLRVGADTFAPVELAPLIEAGVRSRPWLHGELRRLQAAGRVCQEGRGVYRIVPRPEPEAPAA